MIIQTHAPLPERRTWDYYPTPQALCESALNNVLPSNFVPTVVHDPGAGTGRWGDAVKMKYAESFLVGIEPHFEPPENNNYNRWNKQTYQDFLEKSTSKADLIVGNPPYKFAMEFVTGALGSVNNGGYVVYLLRLVFLAGKKRAAGLWKTCPPETVWICNARPSFFENNKTNATDYAVYVWHKGGRKKPPQIRWLIWR